MRKVTLHHPEEIFSRRHVPSWLMLSFSSGCTNAIAFMACQRFVTHITGTVTQAGVQVAHLDIVLDFALVVVCFIVGAMTAAAMINGRAHRGRRPLYTLPMVVVGMTTAAVALAGHAGLLGEFGGAVDEAGDFVLLSMLSFASGLQNAAVATGTGLLVRTTHLTGPATDLGMHIVDLVYTKGAERLSAKRHALLRAGKILAFATGAVAGVMLARSVSFLGFLVPAGIVFAATALSFEPARVRDVLSLHRPKERLDRPAPRADRPARVERPARVDDVGMEA